MAACEREEKLLNDWYVPYLDSPWRYVRISHESGQTIRITRVYDLD